MEMGGSIGDDRSTLMRWMAPATKIGAVTPSDDTELPDNATLYIGSGGTLVVLPIGNDTPESVEVPDHFYFNVVVRKVMAATSAGDIVWLT
jgi:hypothetical protein